MEPAITRSENRQGWITLVALGLTLLLGGGGSPAPLPEIVLQLATLALFVGWFWHLPGGFSRLVPAPARIVAGILLVVPMVQLIPLHPALWQQLPGRGIQAEALALIGHQDSWRPISLVPARTVSAFLAMVSAAALLVMASVMPAALRWRPIALIAGFGIVTLVLGAAQLASAASSPLFFYGADAVVLSGFQANRNSTADILLIAFIASVSLIGHVAQRRRKSLSRAAVVTSAAAIAILFALGVAMTQSRAGVLLIAVALIASLLILRPWLAMSSRSIGIVAMGFALIAAIVWQSQSLDRVARRFDVIADARTDIWHDSIYVARQNAPLGVGMGGFYPAYIANERLEAIGQTVPNRAHNDYLELAVEAGIAGLIALAVCSALIVRAAAVTLRSGADRHMREATIFAVAVLAIAGLHSLVDYPLRSMALAGVVATCAGLIFPAVRLPLRRVQAIGERSPA
ncbi:O-antigen ligase family protein [Novosphingobium sp.]|uniref:O-antigen ligase family protein n=1 Tax=Novosphingobium sp. TaxID=1874826 RepID=UPI0025D2D0C7|nr:O-antigen ligase family protein [Novosphingobium sp.]